MNLNNKCVKFTPSSVELGHFFSQKEYFFFYSKSLCQKGFKVCNCWSSVLTFIFKNEVLSAFRSIKFLCKSGNLFILF